MQPLLNTSEKLNEDFKDRFNEQRRPVDNPVADPGEGPGDRASPLFLAQTEARRAEKKFCFRDRAPHLLISGSGWPGPPLSEGLDPPLQPK